MRHPLDVVVLEPLVVGQITGSGPVEDREDKARILSTNTAGGLDVLGSRLGPTADHHQAEPLHVHTDRHHVGRQEDIEGQLGQVPVMSLPLQFLPLGLYNPRLRGLTRRGKEISGPQRTR